jgi:general secretion pathway protein H
MAVSISCLWGLTVRLAAKVKTPISIANPELPTQRGFTLIELLVVLAIGTFLIAMVPPAFDKLREGSQYRDTVRSLVSGLRQARQQALVTGRVVDYHIDLTSRRYGIVGQADRVIPESLEVKTVVGSAEGPGVSQNATISFMPEGGATGGSIELARPNGGGVRIRVDWLFGQITQERRSP